MLCARSEQEKSGMIPDVRDNDELLAGVAGVRWSRMRHAYGPATEVPGLLRGLADADPEVRETALDAFYGAVHHQGDVYGCTLAALPFLLRIATDTGRPGRAPVVTLIGSIGGVSWDEPPLGPRYRQARREVAAAAPVWLALLTDPDPTVRAAAVPVLAAFTATAEVATTLRERFATDPDPHVRAALVEAVAALARAGVEVEAAAGWLAAVTTGDPRPAQRLAALTGLATLGDRSGVPPVDVHTALTLLATVYERGTPVSGRAGFSTDTLIGTVRELREKADGNRAAPEADGLVRAINHGLGDRVDDRLTLLTTLLRASNWESRLDALYPAGHLMESRRGDYTGLVRLIGARLTDPRPEIVARAVYVLGNLGALAAPAADALVAAIGAGDRVVPYDDRTGRALAGIIEWSGGPGVGDAVQVLARLGDERALPVLRRMLARDRVPWQAPGLVQRLGAGAAGLVPLLHRLLTAGRATPSRDAGGATQSRDDLTEDVVYALAAIGPAATVVVPDLLALGARRSVVWALGRLRSPDGLPLLRECAAGPDHDLAVVATNAAYAIDGDADAALAVYDRFLTGDRWAVAAAVRGIGDLGPSGAGRATALRRLLRRKDEYGWLPLAAAAALWRTAGDPAGAPVLENLWDARPRTRLEIATLWRDMGPAATGAHARLAAELARVGRHSHVEGEFSSGDITDDERLVALCREAIDGGH
jgi:HEAT repeat protein